MFKETKMKDEIDELRTRERDESRNRLEESRRLEERTAAIRCSYKMRTPDPLYIPPEIIPHGWTYYWGRESYHGMPDSHRLTELKLNGWTPVPADRHAWMVADDFLGRSEHLKGYIFRKGLVLHERPSVFTKEERERVNALNKRILNSMPGLDNLMGEPGMPGKVLSNETSYTASYEEVRGF